MVRLWIDHGWTSNSWSSGLTSLQAGFKNMSSSLTSSLKLITLCSYQFIDRTGFKDIPACVLLFPFCCWEKGEKVIIFCFDILIAWYFAVWLMFDSFLWYLIDTQDASMFIHILCPCMICCAYVFCGFDFVAMDYWI